jgi:cytochrome o ubiquinol oxidase subunit 2
MIGFRSSHAGESMDGLEQMCARVDIGARCRRRRPSNSSIARFMCSTLLPGASLLLGGCDAALLSPAGAVGKAERIILLDSLAIMLAIVIPTMVATLAVAWWFRASNSRARRLPGWSYSGRLELIVWSIPALVVMFLGGIGWIAAHDLDPAQPLTSSTPPLELEVVSLDWKWLFIYPQQGIASVNRLVVPAAVPLHLRITSASVFNVFFVPRLGSEIYSMNGMATQLYLQADQPGVYPGLSAHFSGDGFSDMSFDVQAVSAEQFAQWTAAIHGTAPALDDQAYRGLLQQSQAVRPYTFGAVQDGLFERIAQQRLPPGDGPQSGRPSATVSPQPER